MIEISLSTAIAFYSAIILAGALAVWLYTEIDTQRAQTLSAKQHLWRCTYCAFSYLDNAASGYSECPRCHSISAADDKHAREVRIAGAQTPPWLSRHEPSDTPRRNPSHRKRPGARSRGPRKRR